jgi:hypothetical protein
MGYAREKRHLVQNVEKTLNAHLDCAMKMLVYGSLVKAKYVDLT